MTEDLAVSRGLFSLLRSGEILLAGALAPLIGPLVDRYGGRWLMTGGALSAGIGFLLLSQVSAFWQFLLLRWSSIAIGGVLGVQKCNRSSGRQMIWRRSDNLSQTRHPEREVTNHPPHSGSTASISLSRFNARI